jgi:hypothetical protein
MLKLDFYDEKPMIIIIPNSLDLLKERISKNYGFSIEDANEFSYSYFNEENRKYLNNQNDYEELNKFIQERSKALSKRKIQINVLIEINETSKIFTENNQEIIQIENEFPDIKKEEIVIFKDKFPIVKEEEIILSKDEKEIEKFEKIISDFDINRELDFSQSIKMENSNIINEKNEKKSSEKEGKKNNNSNDYDLIFINYPDLNEKENLNEGKINENNKLEKYEDTEIKIFKEKIIVKENNIEEIISKLLTEKIWNLKEEIISTLKGEINQEKKQDEKSKIKLEKIKKKKENKQEDKENEEKLKKKLEKIENKKIEYKQSNKQVDNFEQNLSEKNLFNSNNKTREIFEIIEKKNIKKNEKKVQKKKKK